MHRAGGITGILGELDRAGKLHTNVHSIDYPTLEAKLADWDIMRPTCTEEAQQMYKAAPGPVSYTHLCSCEGRGRNGDVRYREACLISRE